MPKSLVWQLSLGFWVVAFLLACAQLAQVWFFVRAVNTESEQRLHANVAQHIADQLYEPLMQGFDSREVKHILSSVKRINPRLDTFLLDTTGRVRGHSKAYNVCVNSPKGECRIDPAFIDSFFSLDASHHFPITGPNPVRSWRLSPFVAAKIRTADEEGYLYVTLEGREQPAARRGVEDLYMFYGGAITSGILFLLMGLLGTIFFHLVTKRFRGIVQEVSEVAEGDFDRRLPTNGPTEISQLSAAINSMATNIVTSLRRAESSDQRRRELVAHIAHDLGGPVTTMQTYVELIQLEEDSISTEVQRRLDVIHRNARNLGKMIEDLFELSKFEAHDKPIEKERFSLVELAEEELRPRLATLAKERGVEFRLELENPIPDVVADLALIERALINLSENAIRHNHPTNGEVVIELRRKSDALVEVAVRDNGPGIPAEQLAQIFQPFYRGDLARSKHKAGGGLGLAIVKKVLEAHNEQIAVESIVGSGTRFSFCLPVFETSKIDLGE